MPPSGGSIVSDYANGHAIRRKNIYMDQAFIDMMVPHHETAVAAAKVIGTSTERSELKQVAEDMIESQQGEIDQMLASNGRDRVEPWPLQLQLAASRPRPDEASSRPNSKTRPDCALRILPASHTKTWASFFGNSRLYLGTISACTNSAP